MGRTKKNQPIGHGMVQSTSSLGKFIRDARLKSGLLQVELARRANISQTLVSAIELGRLSNESAILRIARALNLDPGVVRQEILKTDSIRSMPTDKGNFIRFLRLGLGLTLEDLAELMGMMPRSVVRLEAGRSKKMQPSMAQSLTEALGVEVSIFSPFLMLSKDPAGNNLGALMRAQRLKLALSQQYLADRVGCSRRMISMIERGVSNMTFRKSEVTLAKLAELLEIPLEDLLQVRATRKVTRKIRPEGTLGAWLTQARLTLGFSQQAFAKEIGVSSHTMGDYETGRRRLGFKARSRIEVVLGRRIPDDLL